MNTTLDLGLTSTGAVPRRYMVPSYRCTLVREKGPDFDARPVIRTSADGARVISKYLEGADREHLVALLLDTRNQVIGITTISTGTLTESLVHPREVFKPAILHNAAGIILGHNHPSGDPDPSPADIVATRRIAEGGKLLGIDVLDHIIIGDAEHWSSLSSLGLI